CSIDGTARHAHSGDATPGPYETCHHAVGRPGLATLALPRPFRRGRPDVPERRHAGLSGGSLHLLACTDGPHDERRGERSPAAAAGGCAAPPGAPTGLSAAVSGTTVALTWQAAAGGCQATSSVIQAGSSPGLSNLANFSTGSAATSFTANNVASGVYYVRVLA